MWPAPASTWSCHAAGDIVDRGREEKEFVQLKFCTIFVLKLSHICAAYFYGYVKMEGVQRMQVLWKGMWFDVEGV